jgi:hypothetical protein
VVLRQSSGFAAGLLLHVLGSCFCSNGDSSWFLPLLSPFDVIVGRESYWLLLLALLGSSLFLGSSLAEPVASAIYEG